MVWQLEVSSGRDKGSRVVIASEGLIIGREPSKCRLILTDQKSSRLHAVVTFSAEGNVMIEDLSSTHGTTLNGSPVSGPTRVNPGDLIEIGDSIIVLNETSAASLSQNESFMSSSISIGRNPNNDLVLNHPAVSWNHARVVKQAGGTFLTVISGSTGTYLNEQLVEGTVRLEPSSQIRIHDRIFLYDGSCLLDETGRRVAHFISAKLNSIQALLKSKVGGLIGFAAILVAVASLLATVSWLTASRIGGSANRLETAAIGMSITGIDFSLSASESLITSYVLDFQNEYFQVEAEAARNQDTVNLYSKMSNDAAEAAEWYREFAQERTEMHELTFETVYDLLDQSAQIKSRAGLASTAAYVFNAAVLVASVIVLVKKVILLYAYFAVLATGLIIFFSALL